MKRMLFSAVALSLVGGAALAGPPTKKDPKTPAKTAAICPVMGSKIADTSKAQKSVYKGKTYYFCCGGCKPAFDKDPAKYATADTKPTKPAKPAKDKKKS